MKKEIIEDRRQLKTLLFLASNQHYAITNLEQEVKTNRNTLSEIEDNIIKTVNRLIHNGDTLPSSFSIKMPKGLAINVSTLKDYEGISFKKNCILAIDEVDIVD